MHLLNKLISFVLLLLPIVSYALPSDRDKPINIEADHAQMDDQQGIAQYKGDAILTQGTLKLEGDIITFYYDENKEIIKVVTQGKRAKYKQVHKVGEDPVRAKALQMEYYADRQKIYLIGNGHIWQNQDEFTGNRIEYDIERNVVVANSAPVKINGAEQKKERIHIIIQPPKKSGSKAKTSSPKSTTQPTAPAPKPTPTISKPIEPVEGYPTAVTTSNLNVRTGPGTQYQKLGILIANQQVIVLTKQPEWSQIRAEIGDEVVIGWVNTRYLN